MDLPKNRFKAALAEGRQQIGLWCSIPGGGYAEMLATCGYDWILIDCEHAPIDLGAVQSMLQAMAPYPVQPVVRPGWNDPVEIKRLLDIGAQSLLIPYVENAEEAARAVAATRYAPAGFRGVAGLARASRYGSVPDYLNRAAQEICVLVQIESLDAVERIEEIAAVEGVDGIFVGPADLSATMGRPGQLSHPEVRAKIIEAIKRIRAAGKPAGIVTLDETLLEESVAAGTNFTAVGIDIAVMLKALRDLRARWPS
ncbi:HpcH/HpaI aldolase family protein [Paracoccus aminophilus]|uniref:Hydroxypyruvate/pyruvate aldolase n=1 Tax=Paracoccus aminophilus JCM 7686 TaxID=1367847 RepID=S5XJ78_PARAH|nr:aldolase/citrate lyase family protein [Paracoccus aminophilus]AGT07239.1 2,4-dihydroxyhept-2-ene-1,7-dioic acid aldolase [Paracoccus aminophilus JCM 7686]